MLEHRMLESPAYACLTPNARAVLQELVMIFNGSNNGSLYLSVRDTAARIGLVDNRAIEAAYDLLMEVGFLELAKDAHFAVKASDTSRARCWRLTWLVWPESPVKDRRRPTNEWRDYRPAGGKEAKRADRRLSTLARFRKAKEDGKMPVVDSPTTPPEMAGFKVGAVVDSSTARPESDAIPPTPVVVDSSTHIDVTKGEGVSFWWTGDTGQRALVNMLALHVIAAHTPVAMAA